MKCYRLYCKDTSSSMRVHRALYAVLRQLVLFWNTASFHKDGSERITELRDVRQNAREQYI